MKNLQSRNAATKRPLFILLLILALTLLACGTFSLPEKLHETTTVISSPQPKNPDSSATFTSSPLPPTPRATAARPDEPVTGTITPITGYPSQCPKSTISQKDAGLVIQGFVYLPDGTGLAGVKIFKAYASYSGDWIATTDDKGCYHSDFFPIPGDEMVRVWAELPGYTFAMANSQISWDSTLYAWRHYHGFEESILNFIASPQ
jgi:hypothetical protein